MFKYLRMAEAMAGSGTLDIERGGENPDPLRENFSLIFPGIAASTSTSRGSSSARSRDRRDKGRLYTGELNARRANRAMFRSAEGGIYYINAPGPGLLLVPAVLVDHSLNRAFGGTGSSR